MPDDWDRERAKPVAVGPPRRRATRVVGEVPLGAEPLLEVHDQLERPLAPARDVLADVHDTRRARLEGEKRVEGRDSVRVGGRHGQPAAELVEAAGADPADPLLQRPEGRQQEMAASCPGRVPSGGGVARDSVGARTAVPAGGRRAEDGVESGSLGRRRLGEREELQVHATGGADRLIAEGSIGTGRWAAVHGPGRK